MPALPPRPDQSASRAIAAHCENQGANLFLGSIKRDLFLRPDLPPRATACRGGQGWPKATAKRRAASFTAPARGGTMVCKEGAESVTKIMVATSAETRCVNPVARKGGRGDFLAGALLGSAAEGDDVGSDAGVDERVVGEFDAWLQLVGEIVELLLRQHIVGRSAG